MNIKELYSKEIGSGIETTMQLINDAYKDLKAQKIDVYRMTGGDAYDWPGIRVETVSGQFSFFMGVWYSFYAATGIPLCLCLQVDYEDQAQIQLGNKVLKDIMLKEPSLYEFRNLEGGPVCGIKSDKLQELSKYGGLAAYLLAIIQISGQHAKLK